MAAADLDGVDHLVRLTHTAYMDCRNQRSIELTQRRAQAALAFEKVGTAVAASVAFEAAPVGVR
jgi:hypothetical protein